MFRPRLVLFALACMAPLHAADIAVVDDSGRRVELAAPAQRIVSLSPALTESLFAVGAGERLVATVASSDFPPAAGQVPTLGDAANLSLEGLIAKQPDLVLAWGSGNPPRLLARLQELGIPLYVSEVRSLEGVAETLEDLGALTGRSDQGESAAAGFRAGIAALRRQYGQARPLRVLYQVWPRPLITVGSPHLISRVLELCGGVNLFADLGDLAPQVALEAVLARDPDVIVAASLDGTASALKQWHAWPQLTAVARDNLISVDADLLHRPTPRLLRGAQQVCDALQEVRASSGVQNR